MPKMIFENIYRSIKDQILSQEYEYGSMLPSENEFTKMYDCSRNTVRRALAQLASEGFVQAIHGKGVQVLYQPVDQAMFTVGGIESFAESAKRNNLSADTKVVQFVDLVCDEHTSKTTGFPIGTDLLYIQRIRLLDDKPVIFDINIFRKDSIGDLTPEIAKNSIYAYLENELGMNITTSQRQITAEHATQIDYKYLDLTDYDFVSVVTSHTYSSEGIMFEYTQSRHRPDHFAFYDTATRQKIQ